MITMEGIKIIGTSHIARSSMEEVRDTIESERPDIVALELDRHRLYSLVNNIQRGPSIRDVLRIGITGYLFTLIGGIIQKKLGNVVGISPGSEMLTAYEAAKKNRLKVSLIDQDIQKTLSRFSTLFNMREKLRVVGDIFKGLLFPDKRLRFDLSKVPSDELVEKLLDEIKVRYPGLHKALIEERNRYMAQALLKLRETYPDSRIVAVVGAGHKRGIMRILDSGL